MSSQLPVKHYCLIDDPSWDIKKNGYRKMNRKEQDRAPATGERVMVRYHRGPTYLGFKFAEFVVANDTEWIDYDTSGDPDEVEKRGYIVIVHCMPYEPPAQSK